jgi:hypothetical protein
MGASGYVHVKVKEIREDTLRAFLLVLENYGEVWVPKSLMADPDHYNVGDRDCEISLKEWYARKINLVQED